MRIKVNVTQEHIDAGVPENGCGCPIALAMIAAGIPYPNVMCTIAYYSKGVERQTCSLPMAAQEFITEFDCNRDVKPFSFEVDLGQV